MAVLIIVVQHPASGAGSIEQPSRVVQSESDGGGLIFFACDAYAPDQAGGDRPAFGIEKCLLKFGIRLLHGKKQLFGVFIRQKTVPAGKPFRELQALFFRIVPYDSGFFLVADRCWQAEVCRSGYLFFHEFR